MIVSARIDQEADDGLTLVNVPMVINVSFRSSLFLLYKLLTASLIPAFRLASSVARLETTAREAALIEGFVCA